MTNLNIAVIGIPGKWSTEILADELESLTDFRLVMGMEEIWWDSDQHRLMFQNHNLCDLDGIIVKKISAEYSPHSIERLNMLKVLEAQGVRIFSPVNSMISLVDRLSCTTTLNQHDIPMPPTRVTEDLTVALQTIQDFHSVVCKPLFSTKARGMCIFNDNQPEEELKKQLLAFKAENPYWYLQKKLELPGQDLGMVFLGGEYLGTYARVAQGQAWNTTINSGGRYAAYSASDNLIELAWQAQAVFNMDFTTVDVAETPEGPVVFEVSAFGGFAGAKQGIGINAAQAYAQYVIEQLNT